MLDQFGPFSLGLVAAHEFGHAIQARAGVDGPTILTEQQADCFAGAWTVWAAEGNSSFEVTLDELDTALAGFLMLADSPGSLSTDASAHGSAFDRVGAFEDGLLNGAQACAAYSVDTLQTFQLPFQDEAEYESGGDMPLADLEPSVVQDLELYWSIVFPDVFGTEWTPVAGALPYDPADPPACGGELYDPELYVDTAYYCVADDYVAWDDVNYLPGLHAGVGDFAAGIVIAHQYSLAAQVRLGNFDYDTAATLQADCFSGTWTASLLPGFRTDLGLEEGLNISPGDLDEAITAFLVLGSSEEESADGTGVTAFERVSAFREGFLNGIQVCAG